jgi:hypothetical protein
MAREYGLRQTSPVLGASQPAFSGEVFDLYYDTFPPEAVLKSWRWHSDRPDLSRPDLLLYERETGRVAVMDAKYRISSDGRASEDSRKEVSSYMALYGLEAVSILFPGGKRLVDVVEGHGRRILEVPISPGVTDLSSASRAILSTLKRPVF